MRILSWNVNGIEARNEALIRLTDEYRPDVICCQKVRTRNLGVGVIPGFLPFTGPINPTQIGGVWTYLGNNTYNSIDEIRCISAGLTEWQTDGGNIQMFDFGKFLLINAYFPYSNKSDKKWLDIRRQWDYELYETLEAVTRKRLIVMCGDMNIVLTDKDAWDNVSVKEAGCFFPWEHKAMEELMKKFNLVDAWRALHPDQREYTYFYQNRPEYRLSNQGHRIDYFLVSADLMLDIQSCDILTDVIDCDSNPIILEI